MPGDHDAYKPAEIAALIETAGVAKAALPLHRMATLAMLAGAFIGFGSAFWCMAMVGADPGFGPQRVLGGMVFALGLILVVVGGAELFTGNALMVMAAVDRRITLGALLRNWGIVYIGNLIGAVGLAVVFRAERAPRRADGRGRGQGGDGQGEPAAAGSVRAGGLVQCSRLSCRVVKLCGADGDRQDYGRPLAGSGIRHPGAGAFGGEHVPVSGGPLGGV